jgi:hypothetical protein
VPARNGRFRSGFEGFLRLEGPSGWGLLRATRGFSPLGNFPQWHAEVPALERSHGLLSAPSQIAFASNRLMLQASRVRFCQLRPVTRCGVAFALRSLRESDMFNVMKESGAASDARPYCDHSRPSCPLTDLPPGARTMTGIDVRSLPAGSEVVVGTCNSRYRFVMLDAGGRNAMVEGAYFPQETTVRIEGSTFGGSLLRIGWIGLDLFLELSSGGKRVVTSRVRSIGVMEVIHDK